jgi:UDP-N-acetylglucosamine acyltransferase
VIGPNVVIGDGTRIESHAVIEPFTTLGANCVIKSHAVLGGEPQDHKFSGERSYLVLGEHNIIREFVTLHRATGEEQATVLGDHNMIMAYCHIGHNCTFGSNISMANGVGVSGHVIVEDRVVFGGMVGVHQFVKIGQLAMVGGMSKVEQDIPPYMKADGRPAEVYDLNIIGCRRAGIRDTVRAELKLAYKLLYRSGFNVSQAIEAIDAEVPPSPERDYLLNFVKNIKYGYRGRQLDTPRA